MKIRVKTLPAVAAKNEEDVVFLIRSAGQLVSSVYLNLDDYLELLISKDLKNEDCYILNTLSKHGLSRGHLISTEEKIRLELHLEQHYAYYDPMPEEINIELEKVSK